MFDYSSTPSEPRSTRALEIAMRARSIEKKQALMAAELKANESGYDRKGTSVSRGLIARLLSTLRIF